MLGSSGAIRRAVNTGSSRRRYLVCSGPSSPSGIALRLLPRYLLAVSTSWLRLTVRMSSIRSSVTVSASVADHRALRRSLDVHRLGLGARARRRALLVAERDVQVLRTAAACCSSALSSTSVMATPKVRLCGQIITLYSSAHGRDRPVQRTVRKKSRTSATKRSGTCIAAKWPPWGCSVQCVMLYRCSAHDRGVRVTSPG